MSVGPLSWSDCFSVGVVDLDDAHQELVDLYNRVAWACEHETAKSQIRERIRTFLIYASWHFEAEEERMLVSRYPDYADHKADHARLLQDAEDFVENLCDSLTRQDAPAIAHYFKYWLSRHMVSRDAKLRAFFERPNSNVTSDGGTARIFSVDGKSTSGGS